MAGDDLDTEKATPTEIWMVEVDGQQLRVAVRRGSPEGPPLLLFNGIGANLELAEPFTAALAGVETIIFDVPGVGGSPARLLPYTMSGLARMASRLLTKLDYDGPVDCLEPPGAARRHSSSPSSTRGVAAA